MNGDIKTMRDAFIGRIHELMKKDRNIFFLCADFGSPKLDDIRKDFGDRFVNVGIAEQNLVNVASGLALEGFAVYAYAIAPFLTMRAYEQIRNNLSLLSHAREVNVNLVGVGAGLSYDVSGPTHHCLEDLAVIGTLPGIEVISPADWVTAEKLADYTVKVKKPKYLRFDGKPLASIYSKENSPDLKTGFHELKKGKEVCLVATGYMTRKALSAAKKLSREGIEAGVVDVFMLRPVDGPALSSALKKYKSVITVEEAFINKGGLDGLVSNLITGGRLDLRLAKIGFGDAYVFEVGGRDYLHKLMKLDEDSIIKKVREMI